MLVFRVQDRAYQIQRVNIDNTIFQLQLSYNDRDESWYLDILDINANPILLSHKLQWGSEITKRYILPQFPNGNLYILKTENRDEKITRNNFSENKLYRLVYITDEELNQTILNLQAHEEELNSDQFTRAKPIFFITADDLFFQTSDLDFFQIYE